MPVPTLSREANGRCRRRGDKPKRCTLYMVFEVITYCSSRWAGGQDGKLDGLGLQSDRISFALGMHHMALLCAFQFSFPPQCSHSCQFWLVVSCWQDSKTILARWISGPASLRRVLARVSPCAAEAVKLSYCNGGANQLYAHNGAFLGPGPLAPLPTAASNKQ